MMATVTWWAVLTWRTVARGLRLRLVTDNALVDRWCVQATTLRWDLYLWARATDPWWTVRVTRLEREDER